MCFCCELSVVCMPRSPSCASHATVKTGQPAGSGCGCMNILRDLRSGGWEERVVSTLLTSETGYRFTRTSLVVDRKTMPVPRVWIGFFGGLRGQQISLFLHACEEVIPCLSYGDLVCRYDFTLPNGTRFAVAAAAKAGQVYVAGASAPSSQWDAAGPVLEKAIASFKLSPVLPAA
jgi:hypothetical protein